MSLEARMTSHVPRDAAHAATKQQSAGKTPETPSVPARSATPAGGFVVPLAGRAHSVIRRCVSCRQPNCLRGELCGYDPTHGGFFPPNQLATVIPYNQARNYPSGGAMEFEHPLAGAALRHAGEGQYYRNEFTIQTPRQTHRAGQSGAGGGISSTGSSGTARGWAHEVGNTLQANPYEAVRMALVDQVNAHDAQNTLTPTAINGLTQWITAQTTDGRITGAEANQLTEWVVRLCYERIYGSRT